MNTASDLCSLITRRLVFGLLVLAFGGTYLRAQTGELALQPSEKIAISIGGVPTDEAVSISKTYSISDAGTINLLHINEVKASGLKPSQLQKRIEEAYRAAEIYTHPTVTVTAVETGEGQRLVYVNSGCQKNGPVPYRPGLTLMQAIGTAGGPTPFAKVSRTQLVRQRATTIHDLKRISKDASLDVQLQPNDQISIPE